MNKAFISGSRSVKSLPPEAIERLNKIAELGMVVLIGDCHGVDALVQQHFKAIGYSNVFVYHLGDKPRQNCGFKSVRVRGKRQVDKNITMARMTDFGLAIWDGHSRGTAQNIQLVVHTRVIHVPIEYSFPEPRKKRQGREATSCRSGTNKLDSSLEESEIFMIIEEKGDKQCFPVVRTIL